MAAEQASDVLAGSRREGSRRALDRLAPGTTAAWTLWALAMITAVLGLVYGLAEQRIAVPLVPQSILSYVVGSAVAVVFASTGLFLRRRRPDIVIGWIFLAIGLVAGTSNSTWAYTLLAAERGDWPGLLDPALVGLVGNTALAPAWFTFITATAVLFPDGRAHRPAWARLLRGSVVAGLLLAIALALIPGPLLFYSFVSNPLDVGEPVASVASFMTDVLLVVLSVLALTALVGLAERYRDAGSIELAQLRWFGWALALVLISGVAAAALAGPWVHSAPFSSDAAWLLFAGSAITVPIAALFAILRYRLYEIDRVISRTFVVGSLTAILAGLYAASIRLFTAAFVGITGESSDSALVLTTLVLATSFTPIKQRLEGVADRRFRALPATQAPGGVVASQELLAQVEAIARRTVDEALANVRDGRPT